MMGNMPAWGSTELGEGLDKVVQFERFGFVRIDSVKDDEFVAILRTGEI